MATLIINIESFLFNDLTFLFVIILVPSAAPQTVEVTANSSTSLEVSWSYVPLEHRNGDITGYEIVLDEEATKTSENIMTKESKRIIFLRKTALKNTRSIKFVLLQIRLSVVVCIVRGLKREPWKMVR